MVDPRLGDTMCYHRRSTGRTGCPLGGSTEQGGGPVRPRRAGGRPSRGVLRPVAGPQRKIVGFGPRGLIHVLFDEAGEVMVGRWSLRVDP